MRHLYYIVLAFLVTAPDAFAQTAGNCQRTGTATADLDVNNVRARLYNNGGLFWRGAGNVYNVPKAPEGNPSSPSAIFASTIWIGGKVDEEIRQVATAYGPWELWPGPLTELGEADDADCSDARYNRIYSVSARDLSRYESSSILIDDLRDWPTGLGAPTLTPAASDGIDNDGDGTTDEAGEMARVDVMDQPLAERKGRVIDLAAGERPDLIGDQMAWWIMNDVAGPHGSTGSPPIGLEIHATAYAYLAAGALDNTTFYRYRLFKRGEGDFEDAYFGYWSDPDLGNASDDFIGTDTTLASAFGFAYNGDNDDEGSDGYGSAPPALGISFVQGPLVDAASQAWTDPDGTRYPNRSRLGMTVSRTFYSSSGPTGNPRSNSSDMYYYLQGLWKDELPIVNCGDGYSPTNRETFPCTVNQQPTTFMLAGDPVTGAFWSELNYDDAGTANTPSDRRHLMSTGPFVLESGEEQTVQFAIVWSRGTSNLNSVATLRRDVSEIGEQFESGFSDRPKFVLPQGVPTLDTPVAGSVVSEGPVQLLATVSGLRDRAEIQIAREVFADTTRSYTNGAVVPLGPGTYRARTRYVAGFEGGPWSGPVAFTVAANPLVPYERGDIVSFEVSANAAGPVIPAQPAAAGFQLFPTPDLDGDGRGDDPTQAQQVGPARWLIYAGGGAGSYDSFLSRAIYSRSGNEERILGHTFEIRFTQHGSLGAVNGMFGQSGPDIQLPFELWSSPTATPDDRSDDLKLIPVLLDHDRDGTFNLSSLDSPVSSGEDDPFTDWVYFADPVDTTPGTSGYDAYANGGTLDMSQIGAEIFGRIVLVSWNAGEAPPYAQALPEEGTVFRIVASGEGVVDAPVLLSPSDEVVFDRAPRLFWSAPPGLIGKVEIATDAEFNSPALFTARYGGGGSPLSVSIDAIDAGTYFWRVSLHERSGPMRSAVRRFSVSTTITADEGDAAAQSLTLLSPSPHPVSGPSRLRFYLPQSSDVRMEAYDLMGRRVAVLAEGNQAQGWREASWPGGLSAGVYLVRLRAGSETQTRQVVVVR